MDSKWIRPLGLMTTVSILSLTIATAHAQASTDQDLPRQPLSETLDMIAEESGYQILYSPDDVAGVMATAARTDLSAMDAVQYALAGSDFQVSAVNDQTLVIRPVSYMVQSQQEGQASNPQSRTAATPVRTAAEITDRIVVTAQRREQDLQDVALSLQALSGEELIGQGVTNTQDLQLRVPGFTMGSNVVFGQPYLRGIGNSTLTIGSDSSVAMHIDGVYLTRPMSAFQEFFDVERVEVLKGPQGTLYGRNATGGVINIISRAPTDEFEAEGRLTLGNYNHARVDATVSGPLGDRVAGRLTAFRAVRDGFTENRFDGSDLDSQDISGLRGQLLFEPNDQFSLRLMADITEENSTRGQGLRWIEPGAGSAGSTYYDDPFVVSKDHPHHTDTQATGLSAHAEWDFGGAELRSITARRTSEFNIGLDLDASDNNVGFVDPETENSETFSQEFQLSGAAGPADWIVGAFYLQEDADTVFDINLPAAGVRTVPNGFTDVTAYAFFGEVTIPFSEQIALTVGGRWSTEQKDAAFQNLVAPGVFTYASGEWDAFTPRATLEFRPTDNVMIYAGYARGFKSGGFNATSAALPSFNPEEIDSFEAGIRSVLADGRLTANLTAFHYDYRDLQVRALVSGIISGVSNAAEASINGLEGSLEYRPSDDVSMYVNLSLLDAEFEDFLTTNPDSATPTAPINLAGNRLPRAPEVMLSAGAERIFYLEQGGELSVRGDVSYQSKMFFDEFNIDPRSQDAFATVNARAGYTAPSGAWSLDVWGRNLTDQVYAVNVLRSAGFYGTAAWYGAPRTFGVTFTVRR